MTYIWNVTDRTKTDLIAFNDKENVKKLIVKNSDLNIYIYILLRNLRLIYVILLPCFRDEHNNNYQVQ